jgi:long-chain fatty acid transport protein
MVIQLLIALALRCRRFVQKTFLGVSSTPSTLQRSHWPPFLCILVAGMIPVSSVYAGGFRIFNQSASGTAQGDAFTAQADDPSAIYYNPAGMTQLGGIQSSFGVNLVGGSYDFTSPTGQTARGDYGNSVAYPPPINGYITANLKDLGFEALGDMTVGVGAIGAFGNMTRWPNNGPFSTAITSAALQMVDVKPTVAYKLNDQFSVGLGMDIYTFFNFWGEGQAENKFNSPGTPGLPPAGTPLEVNGRDTALGFNASFMYTPIRNGDGKPLVNFGFVYRSQATMHLKGQFLVNGNVAADDKVTLVLPQVFTGGIAVWPVRDRDHEWKFEVDVDYTDWKSVRNLNVHLSNGATLPNPQNWRGSYTAMFGTEYKWLRLEKLPQWEVALRGGFLQTQSPVPNATFNPALTDTDRIGVSTGLGLLCKAGGHFLGVIPCGTTGDSKLVPKAIALDVAAQVFFAEPRTITGNLNPTVNGDYQSHEYVGAINVRVNF